MRLDRLEVSGFFHFAEPAVLDLRDIPAGSLVAITGTNGHGKSRLLDAGLAGIYGSFPSRDGVLSDYATASNAYIDVLYSVEGRGEYRSRINVDGERRTSDGVLELTQVDGGRHPLNDGKISTHRDAVAAVFPAKGLVLASAFSAQNRSGSFVALGKKERKDLFATLLGLDHYARMAEIAKACHSAWDRTRILLVDRRAGLLRDTSDDVRADLHARGNELQEHLFDADARRASLDSEIQGAEFARTNVLEQAQSHLVAIERLKALATAIAQARAQADRCDFDDTVARDTYRSHVQRAEHAEVAATRAADAAGVTALSACRDLVRELNIRIEGNQTLIARADDIRAAAAEKEKVEAHLVELRQKVETERAALDLAKEQRDTREGRLRELDVIERSVRGLEERAGLLDKVKFGAECGGDAPCVLVTNAVEAQTQLPVVQAQLRERGTLTEGRDLWRSKYGDAYSRVQGLVEAIASSERQIADLAKTAHYATELAACEARIAGYEAQQAQAAAVLATRQQEIEDEKTSSARVFKQALIDADAALLDAQVAIRARRDEFGATLFALGSEHTELGLAITTTEAAATALVALDGQLATLRAEWTKNEARIATLQERLADLERDRNAVRAKFAERTDVEARLRIAEDRTLVWQTIAKALNRDGLPTLEIAAAGPTISNLTNDLLNACFGTRFSVELLTQEAKADGHGMKETFALSVLDNQYGGDARDIADLSGGERVIVEEALRAAIALFVNSRNQQPCRTLWRDETVGALDPENATRYVAMLRRLMQLGGFAHCLFVSHNLDAAALADVQIEVVNGQPSIRRAA